MSTKGLIWFEIPKIRDSGLLVYTLQATVVFQGQNIRDLEVFRGKMYPELSGTVGNDGKWTRNTPQGPGDRCKSILGHQEPAGGPTWPESQS